MCSLECQVPNRKWPCNLQQRQVLHESCGRSFHRDQDCQVHEEGAGRPLPGRRPLLLLLRPSRTLFLQVKTDFSKLILLNEYLMPRDLTCLNYFCRACWELQHGSGLPHHRPIMRNIRGGGNIDRWMFHISPLSRMSANCCHYFIILGLSSLYLA